jgi:hypothetical protein
MPGLGAAPGGRVGLVDQLNVGAIALLQCACVLLASARLKGCAALTVVAGLKLVTIGQYEKGLAGNAHGFLLVSGFKDHNFLSCGPFLADFWLTGQNSAGDVPGTVVAAEGGDGHGSRFGVIARLGAALAGRVELGVETHQAGVSFGVNAKHLAGCTEDETNSFLEAVFVSAGFSTFQVSSHPGKSVSANGAIGVELIPDPVGVVGDCDGVVGGHGSRFGVPGLPACAHPTSCAAMVNPTVWRLLRTCHNPVAIVPAWHQRTSST